MEDAWLVSRIGYHAVFDESIEDAIDYAAPNGFTSIHVDLNMPAFFPERFTADHRARIRDVAARTGVTIALHAPELALQSLHLIRHPLPRSFQHLIPLPLDVVQPGAQAFRLRLGLGAGRVRFGPSFRHLDSQTVNVGQHILGPSVVARNHSASRGYNALR